MSLLLSARAGLAGTSQVSSAEDLVAHHLDALGDAKTRANCKTRAAQGTAEFKILVDGAGVLKAVMAFEGPELHFVMKFPNNEEWTIQESDLGNNTPLN